MHTVIGATSGDCSSESVAVDSGAGPVLGYRSEPLLSSPQPDSDKRNALLNSGTGMSLDCTVCINNTSLCNNHPDRGVK